MIEPVSSSSGLNKPDLLLWDGRQATVGRRVEYGGFIYEAPELEPSLCQALRLPSQCTDYGSARELHAAIADSFKPYLDSPEREASLLASFSLSTWVSDPLPTAPGLIILGSDEELGVKLLRLLSCSCYHSLILAELTSGSFRSLSRQLPLTLLLKQPELKPELERLLRAASFRGLHLLGNRGRVVDRYGATVIFCGNDAAVDHLRGGAIQISLSPMQLQSSALDGQALEEIANHFQPRLLMYRLRNVLKVRESRVDVSNFSFATRGLARNLAACFPEDSELAHDIVQLLRLQDEEMREQRFRDVNCAIVEILWAMLHQGKQREVRVDELAKAVNALLRSRGEILEYSPEEVGWKVRTKLKIPRHKSSSGSQILFGRDTSQTIHRLARGYDLPCAKFIEANCPDCNQPKATVSR